MGHDIRYYGKLTAKNPLNKEEIALFKGLQENQNIFDRLYALEYSDGYFRFDEESEKIYPNEFYDSIEKYAKILKEGGNDLVDGSYLVSSSEYGIDEEAIVLIYKDGAFTRKAVVDIIEEYVSKIKTAGNNPIGRSPMVVDSWEKETKYKSLNAAILTDIINQSNISSNTESNNTINKMKYFNIEVKNKSLEFGKRGIKTFEMINCQSESLKELVLKLATECHEKEDNDFISLTITQTTKNK